MAVFLQMMYLNAFSLMKMMEFGTNLTQIGFHKSY